jgi:RNA polymerase sigma factor (sigma-70 family)
MSIRSGRALEGPSVPSSSGDSGAFEAFFLKWRPVLLSLSQEILSDADEAEDVAQCILTRLWATGAWTEIAWPGAYIRQAARREALKMRQKRRRWASLGHPGLLAVPSGGPDPAEAVEKQEFLERLEDRIRALPPRCGLVMALTHLQGLTHSEAAERLGISEKAVEKQVRRGRDRLRKWLEREEDGSVSWQSQNSGGGGRGALAALYKGRGSWGGKHKIEGRDSAMKSQPSPTERAPSIPPHWRCTMNSIFVSGRVRLLLAANLLAAALLLTTEASLSEGWITFCPPEAEGCDCLEESGWNPAGCYDNSWHIIECSSNDYCLLRQPE